MEKHSKSKMICLQRGTSLKRVAIFLCDYTGIMATPWRDAGYECWLIDPQHPAGINYSDGFYKVGAVIAPDLNLPDAPHATDILGKLVRSGRVSFVFGFPPCTDVALSGARHWDKKFKEDRYFQAKAAMVGEQCRMVGALSGAPYGFENPKSAFSRMFGKPAFAFDPYEFGGYLPADDQHPKYPDYLPPRDAYHKSTCVWTGNGFIVPEARPVEAVGDQYPGWQKLGGKSMRTKNIRSATPRGFAQAVFEANAALAQVVDITIPPVTATPPTTSRLN